MKTATLIAKRVTKGGKKYPFMVTLDTSAEVQFSENMKLDGFTENFKKAGTVIDNMYLKPATFNGNEVWFTSDSVGNPTAFYSVS